jgi:hypothetical protein
MIRFCRRVKLRLERRLKPLFFNGPLEANIVACRAMIIPESSCRLYSIKDTAGLIFAPFPRRLTPSFIVD